MSHKVHIFTLTTCSHCRSTKEYLNDCGIEYTHLDVDKTTGDERKVVLEEIKKFNPDLSFPTIVIDEDKVIIGFKKSELEEALK